LNELLQAGNSRDKIYIKGPERKFWIYGWH